jgi:ribosomal protein L11 methyltransferase
MPWLEITLECAAGQAEALSEALLEAGAHSVSLENAGEEWARQRLASLWDARADADALVRRAASALGLNDLSWTVATVQEQDWVRRSQAQFQPLLVGTRLWVVPSWHEIPEEASAVVRIDPGMAFGTGSHPSTRLALRFLERAIQGGERVLDYGCGSGILAIAAAKLGASETHAVDIDPQALETTAENARTNRVTVHAAHPGALGAALYDIVVANILTQPLIVLAPLLASHVATGGRIALCGILEDQAGAVRDAYAPWFALGPGAREEGWTLVEGRRR